MSKSKISPQGQAITDLITMMRADYNARLKADMVAMLTELKEKIDNETFDMCDGFYIHGKEKWLVVEKDDIDRLIQEKIKALKEDT